jgi:hypothetical protein
VQVRSDAVTVADPPLLTSVNTRHQVTRGSMPCVVVLDVVGSNHKDAYSLACPERYLGVLPPPVGKLAGRQMHNQDMTREYLHRTWRIPGTALQWIGDHLPKWRRRPPTVGVREPRRPKPSLPAAAVALKEPRVGLMHRIKLGSRRPGD